MTKNFSATISFGSIFALIVLWLLLVVQIVLALYSSGGQLRRTSRYVTVDNLGNLYVISANGRYAIQKLDSQGHL